MSSSSDTPPAGDAAPAPRSGPRGPAPLLRELGLLVLAFALSGALVTLLAGLFTLLEFEEPVRAARKPLPLLFVLVYLWAIRTRRKEAPRILAIADRRGALREVALGFALAAGSLLLLYAVLLATGARAWDVEDPWWKLSGKLVGLVAAALIGSTIEECLFRGVLHHRLARASSTLVAVFIGTLLFSVSHFLKPPPEAPAQGWLDTIPGCLRGIGAAIPERWPEVFGLFLVGLVLVILRVRTGRLWWPIGVHAGWMWVRLNQNSWFAEVDAVVQPHLRIYGTKLNYDGVLGWSALLVTLVLAYRFAGRLRPAGASDKGETA